MNIVAFLAFIIGLCTAPNYCDIRYIDQDEIEISICSQLGNNPCSRRSKYMSSQKNIFKIKRNDKNEMFFYLNKL